MRGWALGLLDSMVAKIPACALILATLLFGVLGGLGAFYAAVPARAEWPHGLLSGRISFASLSINALASAGVLLGAALRLLRDSPRAEQLAAAALAVTLAGTASYGLVAGYVIHTQPAPWDAAGYYGPILVLAMGSLVRARVLGRATKPDNPAHRSSHHVA